MEDKNSTDTKTTIFICFLVSVLNFFKINYSNILLKNKMKHNQALRWINVKSNAKA